MTAISSARLRCSHVRAGGYVFCPDCGERMFQRCAAYPACGFAVPTGDAYCRECGVEQR